MEKAVLFGPNRSLVGIVSEAEGQAVGGGRPAVILLNSGPLHRVGPFRLYVTVARRLAAAGLTVLRMDLSGKGDSEPRRDKRSARERVEEDVRAGMKLLSETRDSDQFVLMGLCSGADDSIEVAAKEPSVVGAVLLDGYGYRTLGYYVRYYGPRMLRLSVWKHFFMRTLLQKKNQPDYALDVREQGIVRFPRVRIGRRRQSFRVRTQR